LTCPAAARIPIDLQADPAHTERVTFPDPDAALADPLALDITMSYRTRASVLAAEGNAVGAIRELMQLAELLIADGELVDATTDLRSAFGLLAHCGDATPLLLLELLELHERQARTASAAGLPDAARLWDDLHDLYAQTGDRERQARCRYERYMASDTSEEGRAALEAAAAFGAEIGWSLRAAAALAGLDSRWADVLELDGLALARARRSGDRHLESLSLEGIAHARAFVGEHVDLEPTLRHSAAAATRAADYVTAFRAYGNLVEVLLDDLRPERALAQARELDGYVRRHYLERMAPAAAALMARAYERLGRLDEALAECERAQDLRQSFPPQALDTPGLCTHARVLLELGRVEAALDEVERAAENLTRFPQPSHALELNLIRAGLAAAAHDAAGARRAAAALVLEEPRTIAPHALRIAVYGCWQSDPALLALASELAAGFDGGAPHTELCAHQVAALASAALDPAGTLETLRSCSERWDETGHALEAARADACSAAVMARGARPRVVASPLAPQPDAHAAATMTRDASTARAAAELLAACHARMGAAGAHADAAEVAVLLDQLAATHGTTGAAILDGLLAGLSARERTLLMSHTARVPFKRGRVFFEPDELSGTVYLLRRGRVRLYRSASEDKQLSVAVLDAGEVFGEAALVGAGAGLGAVGIEDGEVAAIPTGQLRLLLEQVPRLAVNLLRIVGQRLDRADQLAEQIAYASVRQRLARLALELDDRYGRPTLDGRRVIDQSFTQGELATMVGATRKAVAVLIGELRRDGVIDLRGKQLVLVSRPALAQMAERS
jgi:CRP-like cAMP-binding protein/tetratricopeptide (TPR) repeat protein